MTDSTSEVRGNTPDGVRSRFATPEHVRYLDGLRGVAILMVVMVHVSNIVGGLSEPLRNLTFYGVRGVQLFFIVSGLTLTISHLERPLHLANFAARRFFRIAPMFYLATLFYLVIGATTRLRYAPHDAAPSEILATVTFVHDWSVSAHNKVVPGGWSIGCEAMFYLCFPLLLLVLRSKREHFWPGLIAIYGLAGVAYFAIRRYLPGDPETVRSFAFSFWLCHLPAFASGCWLVFRIGHGHVSRRTAGRIALVVMLLLVIDSQLGARTNLLVAILLLSLMVWAVGRARPALLESRAMTGLGEVSFSLYLVHFIVVALLGLIAPPIEAALGAFPAYLLLFAGTLAVAVPISTITYRYVERPFIQMGRNLFRKDATPAAR